MESSRRHSPTRIGEPQADWVLEALRERGSVAREDLAGAAGLSQAATATVLERLLKAGEVVDDEDDGAFRLPKPAAERVPHGDIEITVRTRVGPSGESREMLVRHQPDEDLKVVAETCHAVQADLKIPKRAKRADEERLAALAPFVEEHGSGEDARMRWNRELGPEFTTYATRQSFDKAVERATDSVWARLHKQMVASVNEARETGEPATLELGEAYRSALPGRLARRSSDSAGDFDP